MAKANLALIEAIEKAANKIERGDQYQWGHMGACNCGHLAQEITQLSKAEIHEYAMRKYGDWTEQSMDYCPTSGQPLDLVISQMLSVGLSTEDLRYLEKLSDPEVLGALSSEKKSLKHNIKEDVVLYMRTWAKVLTLRLADKVIIPDLVLKSVNAL